MGGIKKAIKKVIKVGDILPKAVGLPGISDVLYPEEPDTPDSATAEADAAKTVADEKLAAENEAAALANAKAAERAKQRRAGSLLASGGGNSNAQTSSVLAYGKGRLGE